MATKIEETNETAKPTDALAAQEKNIARGDIVLGFISSDDGNVHDIDLQVRKNVKFKLATRIAPLLV